MRCVLVLLLLLSTAAHAAPDVAAYFAAQKRAFAAYEQRDAKEFLAGAEAMLAAHPDHPPAHYAFAAASAFAGDAKTSLRELESLADLGLVQQPRREPAFASLLDDERFAAIEARYAENAKPRGEVRVVLEAKRLPGDFIPEAFARDETSRRTLFSSVRQRRIAAVADDGTVSDFVPAARDGLMSALGIHVVGDAVLVATSGMPEMRPADPALGGTAGVFEFDRRTGALRAKWLLPKPAEGRGRAIGDVLVLDDDRVLASDSARGELLVLDRERGRWTTIDTGGVLASPQGLAPLDDGRIAFADYTTGLWILHGVGAKAKLTRVASDVPAALYGIDGLYAYRGDLVATQNGTNPQRILRLRLNAERDAVVRVEVLASGHPQWDEITLGEVAGDEFRFVANSHWSKFDAQGELPAAGTLSPPTIMAVDLR